MTRWPPPPPGGRIIDLHTHTVFSDGLLSPEALVERARKKQLAALAITDHDSIEAIPLAFAAGGIELVPGVELSSMHAGIDVHILGYYIDPEHAGLRARLEAFRRERHERAARIVERLAAIDIRIDIADVEALAGPGVVGRPHVAEVMRRAGHVATMDEAFRRFLGPMGSAFVRRPAFSSGEAIALIHSANGVAVLAHAGSAMPDAIIVELCDLGLRGLEIWHPQHGPSTVRRLTALATRLGLVTTGGSDFHAPDRGVDLGDMQVPHARLESLKRAAGVAG